MTEEKKMQQKEIKEIDLMVLFRKLYSNRKKYISLSESE